MTLQAFHESDYAVSYEQVDKRAFRDHQLRSDQVIQSLIDRCRADVVAFKPLRQIEQMRRYVSAFPSLRVVWLVRDYRHASVSAAEKWSSIHDSLQVILKNPENAGWRGAGLTTHQCEVLRACYDKKLSLPSAYALFWYLRSSFYFELNLDTEPRVRLFSYEQLTANPQSEFRQIMNFCECRFDENAHRHVRGALQRNSLPSIDGKIAELCNGLHNRFNQILAQRS